MRRRAEEVVGPLPAGASDSDSERFLYELQVHQAELEMQNDELRSSQIDAQDARSRYQRLFDLAPVGYFIFDRQGLILEMNHRGASILHDESRRTRTKPFVLYLKPEYHAPFYRRLQQVFDPSLPDPRTSIDLELQTREASTRFVTMDTRREISDSGIRCFATIQDVTDRIQAEAATRDSEEQLRQMFDYSRDAVYLSVIHDDGSFGPFLEVNDEATRMLGYTREELLGMCPSDLSPGGATPELRARFAELVAAGHGVFEWEHLAKDGARVPVEISAGVFWVGRERRTLALVRDISRRKAGERRIAHLDGVLRIMNDIDTLIMRKDDGGNLIRGVCAALVSNRGYHAAWAILVDEDGRVIGSAEEGVGSGFGQLVQLVENGTPPRCISDARDVTRPVVLHDPSIACRGCPLSGLYSDRSALTIRLTHGERTYGFLSVSIPREEHVDRDAETVLLARLAANMAVVLHGIEDKEQRSLAEASLRRSEELLRTFVENTGEGIVLSDEGGAIVVWNKAMEELTGIATESALGAPIWERHNVLFDLPPANAKRIMQALVEGSVPMDDSLRENWIRGARGERRFVQARPLMVHTALGRRVGAVVRDVTSERMAAEEVSRLLSEKEVLLRETHHRVKNDMNLVGAMLTIQADGAKDPELKEALETAIGRLHTMARVYEGVYRSDDVRSIELSRLVEGMVRETSAGFDDRQIEVSVLVDDVHIPRELSVAVGVIMNELLTNARKYAFRDTEFPRICVEAHVSTDDDPSLQLVIADNGCGPPDDLVSGDRAGFGMTMIRALADQNDGSLVISDASGTRVEVSLRLPTQADADA